MNQGVLTSIFSLGSIIVMIGSVAYIGEMVKFCEYMGTVFIIVGTIVISLTKKESISIGEITKTATEGPFIAIILAIGSCICFGTRSLILKFIAIRYDIDGISASAVFLFVDGFIGGASGIILALNGYIYATFPGMHILYGICSGLFAGIGVLCINIAVSTGVAGPAFAIANLCSVLQAFGDWGFLGQTPDNLEWLGLAVSVCGGIIMSIGDDYILVFLKCKKQKHYEYV